MIISNDKMYLLKLFIPNAATKAFRNKIISINIDPIDFQLNK